MTDKHGPSKRPDLSSILCAMMQRPRSWLILCLVVLLVLETLLTKHHLSLLPSLSLNSNASPTVDCNALQAEAETLPETEFRYIFDLQPPSLAGWEDAWVSQGFISNEAIISRPQFDLVYTYVEASAEFLSYSRQFEANDTTTKASNTKNRIRSWDELRYSLRATVKHATSWLGEVQMIVKHYVAEDGVGRLLTPYWLKPDSLRIINESDLMTHPQCLPSFNSLTIEASLSNLRGSNAHFVSLSDDMLFGQQTTASDFYSPLFGMVMHQYEGGWWALDVEHCPSLPHISDGEQTTAHYTSYLLNKRFGRRIRHLHSHLPKIINREILQEAMSAFPGPALRSLLSRYRGDALQIYTWYLHMWYTIEMHREALLWSTVLSADIDENGRLSAAERIALLARIESGRKLKHRRTAPAPMRSFMVDSLAAAKLEPMRNQQVRWTSMDGPSGLLEVGPFICDAIDFTAHLHAFPESEDLTTRELFTKIVNAPVNVGDCLLKTILDTTNFGLEALLPNPETEYRAVAISAIHKYQYFLARPNQAFLQVHSINDTQAQFKQFHNNLPAFFCVNDDIGDTTSVADLDSIAAEFHELYESSFPDPSPYELTL